MNFRLAIVYWNRNGFLLNHFVLTVIPVLHFSNHLQIGITGSGRGAGAAIAKNLFLINLIMNDA